MQITAAKEHVLAVERRLWRFRHRYARAQRYNHQCEQEKHSRSIGHDVRISKSNCGRSLFHSRSSEKPKFDLRSGISDVNLAVPGSACCKNLD
jgi:hypothetical protein